MTAEQFYQLVRNLRAAQNHYFKTRLQAALLDAKYLEMQVDEELERQHQKHLAKSISLFPMDEGI